MAKHAAARPPLWFSLLTLGCGVDPAAGLGQAPQVEPPKPAEPAPWSACDFTRGSTEVVLAVADGPYGGKQDLVLVRANGESFVAHTFGAERTEPSTHIFISGIEVKMAGELLVADRATDGTVILDRYGRVELAAPDLATAQAFLEAKGLTLKSDEPPLLVEPGNPPTVVLRGPGRDQERRLPLPDYRGEPFVNVEAFRGDWATLSSYPADRTWRVHVSTGIIEPIEKALPSALRQFGFGPDPRLYFTLDDQGGFLASLSDGVVAGIHRSANGAEGWAPIGRGAREIGSIHAYGQQGTYLISGSAGPDVEWPPLPAGHEEVVNGPFTQLARPALPVSYLLPTSAVALSDDGLCAAYLGQPSDGPPQLVVLDVATGRRSAPEPSVRANEHLRFIPPAR